MQRAADRDHVERAEARRQILEAALDQPQRNAGALRRLSGGLDHRGLRVDADDFAAIGRESDREKPRPRADVEQALTSIEAERAGDLGEERRAVGRPGAFGALADAVEPRSRLGRRALENAYRLPTVGTLKLICDPYADAHRSQQDSRPSEGLRRP